MTRAAQVKISTARQSYNIEIAEQAISDFTKNFSFEDYSAIFLLSETELWPQLKILFPRNFIKPENVILIDSGEDSKSIDNLGHCWESLQQAGADRKSLLINFGGGVVTDLGGFVASTYMRGIDFVQIPTSLLAMVDASVGGKTGINHAGVKNLVGAFNQPQAVIVDIRTLNTLSQRELISGMAENFKHGLIFDKDFFEYQSKLDLSNLSNQDLVELIKQSVQIKAAVVNKDEQEAGLRKVLNFGHTAGHAFESLLMGTSQQMTHGEAIGLGMLYEAYLSQKVCGLSSENYQVIAKKLSEYYPSKIPTRIDFEDFYTKVLSDKKTTFGQVSWSLISDIGAYELDQEVSKELCEEVFNIFLDDSEAVEAKSEVSVSYKEEDVIQLSLRGSKSYSNRALILASQMPNSQVKFHNLSNSDDTKVLIEALEKFGIKYSEEGQTGILDIPKTLLPYHGEIDLGPAGTSTRFLTSLVASIPGAEVTITGSERLQSRPVKDLVDALREIGVEIEYLGKDGCPPIKIKGRAKTMNASINLTADVSSQFLSSLLLSATSLADYFEVHLSGEVVSQSYVKMTLDMLEEFGINYVTDQGYIHISNSKPEVKELDIEADATGAAYFWALGALSEKPVRINNLHSPCEQGDIKALNFLKEMGANVELNNEFSQVSQGELKPLNANFVDLPDSAQTFAVLCSLVKGTSCLKGLSTLKHKETDRLAAIQTELAKVNIKTEVSDDQIIIHGGTLEIPAEGVSFDTYEDHRMAMSLAILAKVYPEIKINDPDVVTKSFPDFWSKLADCGVSPANLRS